MCLQNKQIDGDVKQKKQPEEERIVRSAINQVCPTCGCGFIHWDFGWSLIGGIKAPHVSARCAYGHQVDILVVRGTELPQPEESKDSSIEEMLRYGVNPDEPNPNEEWMRNE